MKKHRKENIPVLLRGIGYAHVQMLGISSRRKKKKSPKPDKVFSHSDGNGISGQWSPQDPFKGVCYVENTVRQFLPQAAHRLGN